MSTVEALLAPLDVWRRRALIAGGRPVQEMLVDRELRVTVVGLWVVLSSLALAVLAPFWTLAFGPTLFGVPHLLSDIRYLVVRPGLAQRRGLAITVGVPLIAVCVWPHAWGGLLAAIGTIGSARASVGRRVGGVALASTLYVIARRWPPAADLAVVHLQNLVGVGLWCMRVRLADREIPS